MEKLDDDGWAKRTSKYALKPSKTKKIRRCANYSDATKLKIETWN
jgi:hypothetical protein